MSTGIGVMSVKYKMGIGFVSSHFGFFLRKVLTARSTLILKLYSAVVLLSFASCEREPMIAVLLICVKFSSDLFFVIV